MEPGNSKTICVLGGVRGNCSKTIGAFGSIPDHCQTMLTVFLEDTGFGRTTLTLY